MNIGSLRLGADLAYFISERARDGLPVRRRGRGLSEIYASCESRVMYVGESGGVMRYQSILLGAASLSDCDLTLLSSMKCDGSATSNKI